MNRKSIWAKSYDVIIIEVRFMGLYWDWWRFPIGPNDDPDEFFSLVKNLFRNKLKRPFRMRLHYKDKSYNIK